MPDTTISAQALSKRYRIGALQRGSKTLGETVMDAIVAPVRNALRLRRLTRFDDGPGQETGDVIWALKDVSFEAREGDVLGIIGANGAGKTTLLKILSRITEPASGRVVLGGKVSSLIEVGIGFHPELTGRENIFLNGAILGMRRSEIRGKFSQIVGFAELERFIDTPVKKYSSGMYVRLAFAVAAHLEPEILLIDEVLAVGDMGFQRKCLGKMEDVARRGRTVLFVSHDMSSVRSLCNRAIWLDNGRIAREGEAQKVTLAYQESQIKRFQDASPLEERSPDSVKGSSFYFSRVEMCGEKDEPASIFRYGDKIVLLAQLCGEPPSGRFVVEYYLYNQLGQLVSVGSSGAYHGVYFDPGVRKVKIEIGPLLLTSGRYTVSLSTSSELLGTRTDIWQEACCFTILDAQPFRSGRDISAANEGACILQQSFCAME